VPTLAEHTIFAIAVAIYGVSVLYSVFLHRRGYQEDDRLNYLILMAAFVMHSTALWMRGLQTGHCPTANLYESAVFISWTLLCAVLVLGLSHRLRFLGAFTSPILLMMGVFALMPSLDTPAGQLAMDNQPYTSMHAALILLSYAAFGLAAVAGAMLLTQDHNLKHKKTMVIFSLLPPIQRLEKVVHRLAFAGFILLTSGLAVSVFWMELPIDFSFRSDFKVSWSIFVWAMYLVLLVLHWRFHLRGKKFAVGALLSFVFIILTYWGANMASSLHHP
jgi:ABC-type uncharacterized transport system permease subunit